MSKVDILAIGVHPDDVELSCAGTLMKHIDIGYKVAIMDLTQGELGTRGTRETRMSEAADAASFMGVQERVNLKMRDGFFQNNEENQLKLISHIRRLQPEIILANAISDRHPDHGRAAKFVADTIFLSGLVKVKIEGETTDPWRPKSFFHYIQDYYITPDFVIDVSDYLDKKIEAIMQFKTQFYDPNSEEPETPISSQLFMDSVKAKMAVHGRPIGATYGEGFTSPRYFGVKNLFSLI